MTYRWGPHTGKEKTLFRLWAPAAKAASLELADGKILPMSPADQGWWSIERPTESRILYRFRIGEHSVPDPASRGQTGDVHGWSVAQASTYKWQCKNWKTRPWEETVFYELHTGLLGGFLGVVKELDRLAELGITAIELMPIADFPGARNWGYDGVLPYAPDEAYGSPDDLKALVDAAHARGLMVFLDVVYNHFGPDGNYLPLYAPQFFRSDRKTPWGDAIDFRQEPVRRFFIENALYWLREFRLDGLRFDAVHAIRDDQFLRDMADEILSEMPDRHLILENEDNNATLLKHYRAQWNDDFHNTLHVLLTAETSGYYADFSQTPGIKLARLLHDGFAYQGEFQEHLGRARGQVSRHLPPTAFVSFLQNHDQTGNRAFGERLTKLAAPDALRAAVALQLLSPQIPLLFMGEEGGAATPFLFFTDHQDPQLAKAVREGRAAEFAHFPAFASGNVKVPDPNAISTFEQCRLTEPDKDWLALYQHLLKLRHTLIIPRLAECCCLDSVPLADKAVIATWKMGDGERLTIACNLASMPVTALLPKSPPFYGLPDNSPTILPPVSTLAWMEPT